jgi:hypothetical protein
MEHTRLPALLLAIGLATAGTTLLVACEEREGPAERAGEQVDRAVDELEDTLDPKGPAEKAGEEVDRAVDDLKD